MIQPQFRSSDDKTHRQVLHRHILATFELPTTFIAGFSGHRDLPIRFIEEVSERVEVAKNYRAIPVVPTVR